MFLPSPKNSKYKKGWKFSRIALLITYVKIPLLLYIFYLSDIPPAIGSGTLEAIADSFSTVPIIYIIAFVIIEVLCVIFSLLALINSIKDIVLSKKQGESMCAGIKGLSTSIFTSLWSMLFVVLAPLISTAVAMILIPLVLLASFIIGLASAPDIIVIFKK